MNNIFNNIDFWFWCFFFVNSNTSFNLVNTVKYTVASLLSKEPSTVTPPQRHESIFNCWKLQLQYNRFNFMLRQYHISWQCCVKITLQKSSLYPTQRRRKVERWGVTATSTRPGLSHRLGTAIIQMLWPLATMICGGLCSQIANLWYKICFGLSPQWTVWI